MVGDKARGTAALLIALAAACGQDDGRSGQPFSIDGGDEATSQGDGTSGIDGDGDGDGGPGDGSGDDDVMTSGPGDDGPATSGATTMAMTDDGGEDSTGVANDCPRVQVDVGVGNSLNIRPDPSTANEPVGSLNHGAIVDVLGEVMGESVDGVDLWFHISTDSVEGYIHAGFAACTTDEVPPLDPNAFYLPLQCGAQAVVSQGNFGATSHSGTSAYAFDFAIGLGTPLVAIADGTVTHVFDETGPGDPCYNGGDQSCSGFANYVTLLHNDGTKSVYMHLQSVSVGVGDVIGVGQTVGLSGSTGWSTGRHAHVMRMEDCGGYYCQSIALAFADVGGDGVPGSGDMVTSGNCP